MCRGISQSSNGGRFTLCKTLRRKTTASLSLGLCMDASAQNRLDFKEYGYAKESECASP